MGTVIGAIGVGINLSLNYCVNTPMNFLPSDAVSLSVFLPLALTRHEFLYFKETVPGCGPCME